MTTLSEIKKIIIPTLFKVKLLFRKNNVFEFPYIVFQDSFKEIKDLLFRKITTNSIYFNLEIEMKICKFSEDMKLFLQKICNEFDKKVGTKIEDIKFIFENDFGAAIITSIKPFSNEYNLIIVNPNLYISNFLENFKKKIIEKYNDFKDKEFIKSYYFSISNKNKNIIINITEELYKHIVMEKYDFTNFKTLTDFEKKIKNDIQENNFNLIEIDKLFFKEHPIICKKCKHIHLDNFKELNIKNFKNKENSCQFNLSQYDFQSNSCTSCEKKKMKSNHKPLGYGCGISNNNYQNFIFENRTFCFKKYKEYKIVIEKNKQSYENIFPNIINEDVPKKNKIKIKNNFDIIEDYILNKMFTPRENLRPELFIKKQTTLTTYKMI